MYQCMFSVLSVRKEIHISKKDVCWGDLPLDEMSKGKSAGIQDAG